jgi:hypothetical protein
VLDMLFDQLDNRFVKSQKTFDLADWVGYFAWEVMGLMTFSKTYGFLETGTDVNGLLKAVWDFMLTIAPVSSPWRSIHRMLTYSSLDDPVSIVGQNTLQKFCSGYTQKSGRCTDFKNRFTGHRRKAV